MTFLQRNKVTLFQRLIITTTKKNKEACNNDKKTTFLIGESMLKDTDGYLFTGSINWQYICKVRSFAGAKTMENPSKRF